MSGIQLNAAGKSIAGFMRMFLWVFAFFFCLKIAFELILTGPFLISEKDFVNGVFYSLIVTFYFLITRKYEKSEKRFVKTAGMLALLVILGAIVLVIINRIYP